MVTVTNCVLPKHFWLAETLLWLKIS